MVHGTEGMAPCSDKEARVIGAIVGDVIGSVYERGGMRTTEFPLFQPASRFTDDSVMTIATADPAYRMLCPT